MNQSPKNRKPPYNTDSFPNVQRKKVIEGKMIPAIICNGGYYAFTNLSIYSDGIIDAWGAVDLEFFVKKLSNRWVSTSIPDGEHLSIHHLGQYAIKNGKWNFSPQEFYDYVIDLIKDLNPGSENLFNFYGSDVNIIHGVRHGKVPGASGKPFYKKKIDTYRAEDIMGDSFYLFKKTDKDSYYLCKVFVYEDRTISIHQLPHPEKMSLEEFETQVASGELLVDLPDGAHVKIYGLGEFEVGEVNHTGVSMEAVVAEIEDMLARLNDTPTNSQKCDQAYQAYLKNPSQELRNKLKEAYEKVPEHLRLYILGDMDVKDIPIRMIIYGEEEIKNWSHYEVAKQQGLELPSIEIPQPEDAEEEEE